MSNENLQKIREILLVLKEDANMALNGEWDCTTEEGIETGFNAQIELINVAVNLIDQAV